MDTKVVNKSQVKEALKIPGLPGNIAAALTMRFAGFNTLNEMYSHVADYQGLEFVNKLLEHLGITCSVNSDNLLSLPKSGPLLIVSNHPFEGLDGFLALHLLSQVREDVRVLTNLFVAQIPNIKDYYFSVNTTFGFGRIITNSSSGIKQAEEHLKNGGALVVFPSGEAVSAGKKSDASEWKDYVARMAKRTNACIVPMFIEGKSSWYYQFLKKISVKLSEWRLPKEISNKKGREVAVRIGVPFKANELERFKDDREGAKYLRCRTYLLEEEMNAQPEGVKNAADIAPHVPVDLLVREIEENKESVLFELGTYSAYLFEYEKIPNLIRELGVCREEAFRDVGEGTGKAVDLDEFDPYYKHLILWDNQKNNLIGAYRLGLGAEIYEKYGVKGFYSNSFFRFSEKFAPILKESIELGRSFISVKYQKDTMALLFLLKGLFYSVMRYTEYKHFLGPVSISSWYPLFYRSLMHYYLSKKTPSPEFKGMTNPVTPFVDDFGKVDIETLLKGKTDSLEVFDRYMYKISGGKYRFPTLVKKYLRLGSKFIEYNVDPDFNDCLDCLIMLTFSDVPTDDIDSLCREFEDHRPIYQRFYGSEL